jgi:chloramphenicol 3-O phosphotransferase
MKYPQIILLNGACSSGKTTLSNELRKIAPLPYFYYSSDQLVDASVLPDVNRKTNNTDWSWNIIRPKFFSGFHYSIAAFAKANNFMIVEHIVEYKEWLNDLVNILSPFKVFYVGVFCPIEEIERREIKRGNRMIGEGRSHLEDGIHTWSDYDLIVDTFNQTPEENARIIFQTIEKKKDDQTIFDILFEKIQIKQEKIAP